MAYKKLNNKQVLNVEESLAKLDEMAREKARKVEEFRKKDFENEQTQKDELDSAFYFSIVFNTRRERDEWLQKHHIKLQDDFFVKAEDFNV